MGRLIDADKFLEKVKKDREHECYLHSWTADMVLKRLDSWYAPTVEAIPKEQYEKRLKADLEAMLTEVKNSIDVLRTRPDVLTDDDKQDLLIECIGYIENKINTLQEHQGVTDYVHSISQRFYTEDEVVAMYQTLQQKCKNLWDARYDVWLDNQYYLGKSDTLDEVNEIIQAQINDLNSN